MKMDRVFNDKEKQDIKLYIRAILLFLPYAIPFNFRKFIKDQKYTEKEKHLYLSIKHFLIYADDLQYKEVKEGIEDKLKYFEKTHEKFKKIFDGCDSYNITFEISPYYIQQYGDDYYVDSHIAFVAGDILYKALTDKRKKSIYSKIRGKKLWRWIEYLTQ